MMETHRLQQNSQKLTTRECTQGRRKGGRSRKHQTRTDDHQSSEYTDLTNTDTCPRCRGLLVQAYFMDACDLSRLWVSGWRCINCGTIIDSVIIRNQEYSHPNTRASRHPRLPKVVPTKGR